MAPPAVCFTASTPLITPRATRSTPRCAAVRMSAGAGEKQSLLDWALSKIMPHQDEDDKWGYEGSFKEIMDERDEAKKAAYKELEGK